MNKAIAILLSGIVAFSSSVLNGQDSKQSAEKEEELRHELLKKARVLIDDVATGALSLKLPENRSLVLATAADLMWEHDEKRARNLFRDAHNTLTLMPVAPPDSKQQQANNAYFATTGLRRELLRKVARRDPQLAMDIFRSYHLAIPESAKTFYPQEQDLEQELTSFIALRDPVRSLEIAREVLSRGFSFQLLELLWNLNQRDQEAGSKFAGDIISKLQTISLSTDHVAARIAINLVLDSRERVPERGESRPLKLEQEQRRELVQLIANSALGLNPNPNLLYSLDEIMLEVKEFAPERVALLQKKLAAFRQTLNKEQKGWNTHNEMVRGGNPEQMLRASLALDDEQRISLQRQAVTIALFKGRTDALREAINNEISDESARRPLIDFLDGELITLASSKGDADALRNLLPKIRLGEERARAMAGIALLLEKNGKHNEAVELLDEARTLVRIDLESETQSNALLALVGAYAVVDPAKAFAILEKSIDRINSELSKLHLLDKIKSTGMIKKGELLLNQSGALPIDYFAFQYSGGIAALAKADFERTRALADRISRNELRLMMRLMLARAILDSARKPSRKEERG